MLPTNKLKDIINKYNGIITTNLVEQKGIHREYLNSLVKAGEIERVSHGVYISPDVWEDMLYINQLKREKMICNTFTKEDSAARLITAQGSSASSFAYII